MAMEYRDKHVVVTGGTGALGGAVVAALLEAGALCHVPYIHEAEAERFPHRRHERLTLITGANLADEAAEARLYGGLPPLWAALPIAGGLATAAITGTGKAARAGRRRGRRRARRPCS